MRSRASWQLTHAQRPSECAGFRYRHGCDPPRAIGAPPDRRPRVQSRSQGRLLIVAWLTAWIATVPLFHIHLPDTTDGWSILQSGGAHTVLTPDLPGEYTPPYLDSH